MKREEIAKQYFLQGYNCAQAVALAFADLTGCDESTLAKAASSFGGGMGRLREVCGALSGAFLVEGLVEGYDSADAKQQKAEQYARVQQIAHSFAEENGAIVCRDLLTGASTAPTPEQRTQAYYKKRPCAELVQSSAHILASLLVERGIIDEL